MNDWLLLIVGAASILVGAAIGYYAAAADLSEERAEAWRAGYEAGRNEEDT